ncbi:PH domain-containing protein [Caenorhabditis elegans]|uniref:PH domain-containing protein n=1 Tax=Caenorhabditis elegans TaxID=6239 RepID=G5EC19_CAEEL|nr:PH domain-containing protein [Caenorhabditis elegans]CAA94223.2 PH domain-containing protein [Caenorhabditis elegans]|eukprot:NP_741923.1 Oxysterol Binding protein (OSBP) Related [Caenorhabditis elegans]
MEEFDENSRKSLKKQKKEYRDEKKRVNDELLSALRDPTVVVMADTLKIRGALKRWNRYYCVLKPGLLILYKHKKADRGDWVGTVLLNHCELIERPSKKDGFCFKLFHPMDMSIWGNRGPLGQSFGSFTLNPLNTSFLICRAPSDQAGRCWMDALELSFKCTGLLKKTMNELDDKNGDSSMNDGQRDESRMSRDSDGDDTRELAVSETDAEKHFQEIDDVQDEDHEDGKMSETSDTIREAFTESAWIPSPKEVFGPDGSLTEEVGEENKSLIWTLLKQIRPGMDLSKVVLPTFILEPRSFLEKLADYYYHADLISEAVAEPDPFQRIVKVTKFFLSGFYKKPKGLKKPYNPILGETFRCKWEHPDGSTTFYMAEQVSHHPPVSSLFITNRKAGFNISGTILAKSKYYGNSLSAILAGKLRLTLLNLGETYIVNLPYANCKGIMIGTMTMELGGEVNIECEKTGYRTTLDFKLKPMLGGAYNQIEGSIKYGSDRLASIEGAWDGVIRIKGPDGKKELWNPTPEVIKTRLPRYEINMDEQGEWESAKLWRHVTEAISNEDQYKATEEKTALENDQRARAKSGIPHETKFFKKQHGDDYVYIHADYRPWDNNNDIQQIENNYVVKTISRHSKRKTGNSEQLGSDNTSEASESDEEVIEPKIKKKEIVPAKSKPITPEVADERIKEMERKFELAIRRMEAANERQSSRTLNAIQSTLLFVFVVTSVVQSIFMFFMLRK